LPHAIRTNKLIDVTLEPARLHTLQDKWRAELPSLISTS
jgi:hypothetical protein